MGLGNSKVSQRLRRHKDVPQRSVSDIKVDVEEQMQEFCQILDPLFAENGVSFYAAYGNQKPSCPRPRLSSQRDRLWHAFNARERGIMADIIVEENLRKKVKRAHVATERLQLLVRRKEIQQQELKDKLDQQLNEIVNRRALLQKRLLPASNTVIMQFGDSLISLAQ